jgi:hypothetical protein
MYAILEKATYIYDELEHSWDNDETRKIVTFVLVILFLGSLGVIELNRNGLLPPSISPHLPTSHYYAVNLAFTLILIVEVLSLVFVLPTSFSRSVGKQFEILALILLRSSFKELKYFSEPIGYDGRLEPLLHIFSDGFGALAVFALLGVYYRLRAGTFEGGSGEGLWEFVAVKKLIALFLLAAFAGLAATSVIDIVLGQDPIRFFASFYTLLIFSDVLILLISQRRHPSFHVVFRNSGFAVSTLLIRLALAAPPYVNAIIGIGAALFAVLVLWASNALYKGRKI